MTEISDITSLHGAVGSRRAYTEHVLSPRQKWKYWLLIGLWAGLSLVFWSWWLKPSHVISPWSYAVVTAAIFWLYFLQFYFLAMFLNARRSAARIADLGDVRVAMVVTKAPSEPFSVLKKTLTAMLEQDVPHDTWLADEDPQPETIKWCEARGIKISTRKGRDDYHSQTWPRRTRCKEGNLAYFYDHFGYDQYDFVSQLDADHVPTPTYLREMLRPFADPEVGYVSAPSMCSNNANQSWAARTRLFAEAMFHGVLQAGYCGGWAPMCIGSHYAVRTKALKDVGGLGPELAEDHSTSMILNAGGWRGMHAMDALAYGDGPGSFPDMVTQEFQWSRSLVTLLLQHTPNYIRDLPLRLKFQFVFCQVWYPLFAVFMALMYALPIAALVFDMRFADVTYPGFLLHAIPPMIVLILIAYLVKRDGLFRPHDGKVLSWERVLFATAQWPWVLWGSLMAVRDWITGRFVDFRITPKGDAVVSHLPPRVILPYLLLASGAMLPVLLIDTVEEAKGFYLLSLLNAAIYTITFAVVTIQHLKENGINLRKFGFSELLQFATSTILVLTLSAAVWLRGVESIAALSIGIEPLHVTDTKFMVSGAGQAQPGTVRYVFDLYWDY